MEKVARTSVFDVCCALCMHSAFHFRWKPVAGNLCFVKIIFGNATNFFLKYKNYKNNRHRLLRMLFLHVYFIMSYRLLNACPS